MIARPGRRGNRTGNDSRAKDAIMASIIFSRRGYMIQDAVEARLRSLEARVEGLAAALKARDREIRDLKDVEAIKRLQCAYGYYLEHWMSDEIIDCFSSSPEVSGTFVEGTYKGPEGIRRYFKPGRAMPREVLHLVMQVSPVITVNKDGKTAH